MRREQLSVLVVERECCASQVRAQIRIHANADLDVALGIDALQMREGLKIIRRSRGTARPKA
jgi:hypothetical protein